MKRKTLLRIVRSMLPILAHVEYKGVENVPRQGGVIIATNHMSRMDIPVLLLNPPRPDLTALVADKYQKYPFFRLFIQTCEGIWIDRSKADFTAFRDARQALKQGRALGIAPEGTRSKTGQLLEGKAGTILLAYQANAPIVPVGIAGTEDIIRQILHLRRSQITVRFGPLYIPPPLDRQNRDAGLQSATDELMCRIAALLPEKYHGFYACHPRLREFLGSDI